MRSILQEGGVIIPSMRRTWWVILSLLLIVGAIARDSHPDLAEDESDTLDFPNFPPIIYAHTQNAPTGKSIRPGRL